MNAPTTKRETILLVGREPMLAGALVHLLDERGIDLRVAREATDALSKFWLDHHPVVVIDLTVPGIDAVGVVRSLKGEPGSPKILVVGPDGALVDLRRALAKEHRPEELVRSETPPEQIAEHVVSLVRPPAPEGVVNVSGADPSFAGLLVELWRTSATGVLDVEAESVRTTVFFLNGEPVFAEHGAVADSLGRTLVRTGLVTEAQLSRAFEHLAVRPAGSEQMRLGEVLIELGILAPDQVHDAIRQQVVDKLVACFQGRSVRHRYREGGDFLHDVGIFKCAVPKLLLAGVRRWYDLPRVQSILGPRAERYPRLRSDLSTVVSRFGLGASELRMLRSLTGTKALGRLIESSVLDRVSTSQVLTALLLTDELELWTEPATRDLPPVEGSQDLAPRAPSAPGSAEEGGFIVAEYLRMKGKSDAEVLRVRPDATEAEIDEGFALGELRFGPEAARVLPPHLARKASEIYALMRASRDRMCSRLRDRRAGVSGLGGTADLVRAPMERELRSIAEAAYQRGKQLLAENAPGQAREELRRAALAMPAVCELQLLAEYAEYLVANDDAARREAKERARAWAEKTLAEDPRHAKAHAILGRFLRLDGALDDAERHLERALALDHTDRLPEVELRLIAKQRGASGRRRRNG
ncbi:hypothetical protein L6R52_30095 [Myxococcota bacterium]|nr:hypothetical protein [Myxococcota bacterium]